MSSAFEGLDEEGAAGDDEEGEVNGFGGKGKTGGQKGGKK